MKIIKIREYRKANGYRQSDLAKLLGIKQNTYSRKESGKSRFTIDEITMLTHIFKVTYDDLLN